MGWWLCLPSTKPKPYEKFTDWIELVDEYLGDSNLYVIGKAMSERKEEDPLRPIKGETLQERFHEYSKPVYDPHDPANWGKPTKRNLVFND